MTTNENSDLESRTTIHFPRPVSIIELRRMFSNIARATNCKFDYRTETSEFIGRDFAEEYVQENHVTRLEGKVVNGMKSIDFACEVYTDDSRERVSTKFSGMEFRTTPGYTLSELKRRISDDLPTADLLRERITLYFSNHPQHK